MSWNNIEPRHKCMQMYACVACHDYDAVLRFLLLVCFVLVGSCWPCGGSAKADAGVAQQLLGSSVIMRQLVVETVEDLMTFKNPAPWGLCASIPDVDPTPIL